MTVMAPVVVGAADMNCLRLSAPGELAGLDDAAFRQFDLERVLALRLGVGESQIGGAAETWLVWGLPDQHAFRLRYAPGPRPDASQSEASRIDLALGHDQGHGGGNQRELIGGPVAEL